MRRIRYQSSSATAAETKIEVVRLERLITRENANALSIFAVPDAMPRSAVFSGPFERYAQKYVATEFSMIVVITSLTFSLTLNHAGMNAQNAPASIAAIRHSGTAITAGAPLNFAPTSAEAIAPK